jgi:hypothetical protein
LFPVDRKRVGKSLLVLGVAVEFLGTLLVSADFKTAGIAVGGFALVAVVVGYLALE